MILNTHKEIQHLKKVGFREKEAEAIVELHVKKIDELATKADLAAIISVLSTEIRAELALFRTETKSEFAELKVEIAQVKMK